MPPGSNTLDGPPPAEPQKRERTLWLWVAIGLGAAGGFLAGVLTVPIPELSLGFVLRLAIAFLLSVGVHEAGHVIGGALAGFRILAVAIKPVRVYRSDMGWRLGWMRRTNLIGFYVPDPVSADNLEKRMYFMVAAGPATSALASVACVISANLADFPPWMISQLNLLALWSLFFAAVSLLPSRKRGGQIGMSDGQRLRILLRGGEDAVRFCSLALLGAASMGGVRPRDWNPKLIERLGSLGDESHDGISAQSYRYTWLLDTGQTEQASEALSWIMARTLPEEVRPIFWLEAGWFQAKFRNDPVAARRWMESVQRRRNTPEEECSYWKFEATLALVEKRWADADEAARKGLRQCPRLANAGVAAAIRGEFERVLEETAVAMAR